MDGNYLAIQSKGSAGTHSSQTPDGAAGSTFHEALVQAQSTGAQFRSSMQSQLTASLEVALSQKLNRAFRME